MSGGMSASQRAIWDFCMKHSDGPKENVEGIPERSPEDYDWLKKAISEVKSDYERMEQCFKILGEEAVDVDSKVVAMEEVLFYVEDLDNAADFCKKMKGARAILDLIGEKTPPILREGAANIVGTCCQNNIVCQGIFLAEKALPTLIVQLAREEVPACRTKLLYALSCVVRGNRAMLTAFFHEPGALATVAAQLRHVDADPRSVKKALFMLICLWRDDPTMTDRPQPPCEPEHLDSLKAMLSHSDPDVVDLAKEYLEQLALNGHKEKLVAAGLPTGSA